MGSWDQVLDTGLGLLFPPYSNMQDQERTDDALNKQLQASEESRQLMGDQWNYLKDLNEPLIDLGDEQIQALENGIRSGRFMADESVFDNYTGYRAGLYSPQDMYQDEGVQPTFNGPNAVQYSEEGLPSLAGQRQFSDSGQSPTLASQRDYSFSDQQPGQYQFNQYQNQQQSPDSFQYNQQQPQFTQYQDTQQQPQQYIAGQAQSANYWTPEQFNINNDPVYQNALKNANEATQASAAAQGSQLSGETLKALNANAVDLANQYGDQAFNRYATQQGINQSAQNYQNEDTYNRYINNVGIRSAEGQQALDQYNTNRQYGQTSNLENAQMGNTLWNTGFQNALSGQGQNYNQYAQNRGMDLSEYQTNLGGEQWGYGTNLGQYNTNRDYNLGLNQTLSSDDLARYSAQTGQYNADRSYGFDVTQAQSADDLARYGAQAGQYNQNLQNELAVQNQAWNQAYTPYTTNLAQYNQNRDFNYGVYNNYGDQSFQATQYNNANRQAENLTQYAQLQDTYNRAADRGSQLYGQIGDLANLGVGARQNLGTAAGDYWGSMADLSIGGANAYAAAQAAKNQNNGILDILGL